MKNNVFNVLDKLLKLDTKSDYWGIDNLGGEKLTLYRELRVSYLAQLKEHAFKLDADYDVVMHEIDEVETKLMNVALSWRRRD